MQVTEIQLFNNPAPVYVTSTGYERNSRIVVSVDGYLELGVVKREVNINNPTLVDVVRIASKEDYSAMCENCKTARAMLPEIKKEASKLGLDMKIGNVALNLDRTKVTVNYTAEGRVDFRELVKTLGAKYKSRIEMRQIGNRDETKIIGAIGVCGQVCCCKRFLNDFDKVSIKMAKNQNIALNPNKINGMCGRLLCCLKYEDDYYEEMNKIMPKVKSKVSTPDGVGVVNSCDVIKQTVSVLFTKDETSEIKTYTLDEINANKPNKTK